MIAKMAVVIGQDQAQRRGRGKRSSRAPIHALLTVTWPQKGARSSCVLRPAHHSRSSRGALCDGVGTMESTCSGSSVQRSPSKLAASRSPPTSPNKRQPQQPQPPPGQQQVHQHQKPLSVMRWLRNVTQSSMSWKRALEPAPEARGLAQLDRHHAHLVRDEEEVRYGHGVPVGLEQALGPAVGPRGVRGVLCRRARPKPASHCGHAAERRGRGQASRPPPNRQHPLCGVWAQTCVNGEKTSTDAQMSAVHGGYISVTQKSGQLSIVHVNARWNSRTTYMAQPIACWHYLPAGITCPLALHAR